VHTGADDDGVEGSTAVLDRLQPSVTDPSPKQVMSEGGLLDLNGWPLRIG
jgi:hypothetical protein